MELPPLKRIGELLSAEQTKPQTWVGPSYLPKGGTLIKGGGAKVGKSFSLLEEIRDLLLGNPVYGHPYLLPEAEAPTILLFEQELGEWGLSLRINKLLANFPASLLEKVHYISKLPGFALDNPSGAKLLDEIVSAVNPDIIILDPIGRMLEGDDNSNLVSRAFYNNLDRVLLNHPGCSAIIAHHFRKPSNEDASKNTNADIHSFRGGVQWVANPDTVFTLSRKGKASPHSWWVLTSSITRQGPPPDDFYLEVNPYNTSRVIYTRPAAEVPFYGFSLEPPDFSLDTPSPTR